MASYFSSVSIHGSDSNKTNTVPLYCLEREAVIIQYYQYQIGNYYLLLVMSEVMSFIGQKYKLERSENFDAYLRELGKFQ